MPKCPVSLKIEKACGLNLVKYHSSYCTDVLLPIDLIVVIKPSHRGQGLGRYLMKGCEDLALKNGFHVLYLSTHDQVDFYGKLGFQLCDPICYYGAGQLPVQSKVTFNIPSSYYRPEHTLFLG